MDLAALEQEARAALDGSAYDFYAGGADDELTLADNVAAWQRMRLRPRVLRDVEAVSTTTTVAGTEVGCPILIAPTAYHRMADDEGEAATARGAAAAGALMVASTMATVTLEDIAAAAPDAPRWFQVYVRTDRAWSAELLSRAVETGYRALVLTVDLPVLGYRPRDERNDFTLPDGMELANAGQEIPEVEGSGLSAYVSAELEPSLTFEDIGWVHEHAGGRPVLVKGVLRADDAVRAVEAGADGIIVSNHGGRQLDTAIATADALPEIVDAVGGRAEVYVDGGIRRGTDVVKALALGARGVLIGRPVLWGLATGGAGGVTAVLEELRAQLERGMALCGAADLDELTPDLVIRGERDRIR